MLYAHRTFEQQLSLPTDIALQYYAEHLTPQPIQRVVPAKRALPVPVTAANPPIKQLPVPPANANAAGASRRVEETTDKFVFDYQAFRNVLDFLNAKPTIDFMNTAPAFASFANHHVIDVDGCAADAAGAIDGFTTKTEPFVPYPDVLRDISTSNRHHRKYSAPRASENAKRHSGEMAVVGSHHALPHPDGDDDADADDATEQDDACDAHATLTAHGRVESIRSIIDAVRTEMLKVTPKSTCTRYLSDESTSESVQCVANATTTTACDADGEDDEVFDALDESQEHAAEHFAKVTTTTTSKNSRAPHAPLNSRNCSSSSASKHANIVAFSPAYSPARFGGAPRAEHRSMAPQHRHNSYDRDRHDRDRGRSSGRDTYHHHHRDRDDGRHRGDGGGGGDLETGYDDRDADSFTRSGSNADGGPEDAIGMRFGMVWGVGQAILFGKY